MEQRRNSEGMDRVLAQLEALVRGDKLSVADIQTETDPKARAAIKLIQQFSQRAREREEANRIAKADVERAYAEHRRIRKELSVLLHRFPGAVWTTDAELHVVSAAGAGAGLLGLTEQSLGKPLADHVPAAGLAIGALHAVADLGRGHYEFQHEGRTYQVSVTPLETPGHAANLIWVAADVTEHRRVDAEMIRARLERGQKLEQLGLLAGGIALDFNNLLTAILGNASLARNVLPDDSEATGFIEHIEESADVAADLTRQLLAYSGKGKIVVESVDTSGVVAHMVKLLRSSVTKGARFEFDLADDLPEIQADRAQLRQLVMNLITNASDALPGGQGTIRLHTSMVELDQNFLAPLAGADDLSAGRYIKLEVKDTGHGMDAETLEQIFDPFFTTKPRGHGLGLAATMGIVRGHRGKIRVSSSPGVGTSFELYLKVTPPIGAPQAVRLAPVADLPKEGAVVLVVDDEEAVRRMATAALTRADFEVVTAANGVEALKRLGERPDINVVLLDVMMPRMDGAQALRLLRERGPQLRIILTSGYGEQSVLERLRPNSGVAFLKKPYRAEDVVSMVNEALAG